MLLNDLNTHLMKYHLQKCLLELPQELTQLNNTKHIWLRSEQRLSELADAKKPSNLQYLIN